MTIFLLQTPSMYTLRDFSLRLPVRSGQWCSAREFLSSPTTRISVAVLCLQISIKVRQMNVTGDSVPGWVCANLTSSLRSLPPLPCSAPVTQCSPPWLCSSRKLERPPESHQSPFSGNIPSQQGWAPGGLHLCSRTRFPGSQLAGTGVGTSAKMNLLTLSRGDLKFHW